MLATMLPSYAGHKQSQERIVTRIDQCHFAIYLAHRCSDYLAHDRSWRTLPDRERVSDGRNVPGLNVLSPDLLPLCQLVSTEVHHIIRKATHISMRRFRHL